MKRILKKPSRRNIVDAAIPFLLLLLSFLFSSIWILLMGKNPLCVCIFVRRGFRFSGSISKHD